MSQTMREWLDKVIKELRKHTNRDDCYSCKQLLKEPFVKTYIAAMEARDKLK